MTGTREIDVPLKRAAHKYKIRIGTQILPELGAFARRSVGEKARQACIISNRKVFGYYGEAAQQSLEMVDFRVSVFLMPDGERYKNWGVLEKVLAFFSEQKITRSDAVVALGGGVVGDLAGFASAIFLRGLAFLQIPTTLLAMIDSSVGGKTGVNSSFGKNLIGVFHQPHGVLVDVGTLKTLSRRELTAGFCEAVKQAAIAERNLFNLTAEFLRDFSSGKLKNFFCDEKFVDELENLIVAQIAFKAKIVMQDEKEDTERTDGNSRKILNFGHTLAHALEKVTDYKYFKHGEAVGYGVMFAAELSKKLEILSENELNLLNDVLHSVGKLPDTRSISLEKVFRAFAFDKKVIGKSLQWILLEEIGKPIIVENKDIPPTVVNETLKKILQI